MWTLLSMMLMMLVSQLQLEYKADGTMITTKNIRDSVWIVNLVSYGFWDKEVVKPPPCFQNKRTKKKKKKKKKKHREDGELSNNPISGGLRDWTNGKTIWARTKSASKWSSSLGYKPKIKTMLLKKLSSGMNCYSTKFTYMHLLQVHRR